MNVFFHVNKPSRTRTLDSIEIFVVFILKLPIVTLKSKFVVLFPVFVVQCLQIETTAQCTTARVTLPQSSRPVTVADAEVARLALLDSLADALADDGGDAASSSSMVQLRGVSIARV